jgi:pimeloyl-ACP methyl ester carboxylesterase
VTHRRDNGEDTARSIPGAELVIVPGMGHNIPHGLAPVIAEHVLGFIARH